MKIAFKYIYYKAAASKIFTVDLSTDDWQNFLWAEPKDRKKVLCAILGHNEWYYTHIRELTWIPLEGNQIIPDPRYQLTRKQDTPTYMLGDYTRAFLQKNRVELVEALLQECRMGNINRMQLAIVFDTMERVIIAPMECVRIPFLGITHLHGNRMKRTIWNSFSTLLFRSQSPLIQRWLWIRHTDFVEAVQRNIYVDENLNPFWYKSKVENSDSLYDKMPSLTLQSMGFAIVDGKVVNDMREEHESYSHEYEPKNK